MAKLSLRNASIGCLAIWASVWFLFLLMRFTPLDIGVIPGIGMVMLVALGLTFLAPIVAVGFAGAAVVRRPREPLNWLMLGCAVAALFGQERLFLIKGWM